MDEFIDNLLLECPNCQSCYNIADWGINIPEGTTEPRTIEQWEIFTQDNHQRLDCPDCKETVIIEDLNCV